MQINRINSAQNFKGVHVVKIPKTFFDHPEDTIECSEVFNDIANIILEQDYKPSLKNNIKLKLGIRDSVKFLTFLESPGYEKIQHLIRNKYVSEMWLARNSKTNLTMPMEKDKHTFFILTGEEKNMAQREYSLINFLKISREASKKYEATEEPRLNYLRKNAKIAEIMDKIFTKIIKNSVANIWSVKTQADWVSVIRAIAHFDD